jgi:TPR repeat protein
VQISISQKGAQTRQSEEYNKELAKLQYEKGKENYDKKNFIEAIKWYRKAAELGDVQAQYDLGFMLCEYRITDKGFEAPDYYDPEEALKWLKKSAMQGNVDAQSYLGYAYDRIPIFDHDENESLKWFLKAAEQGDYQSIAAVADKFFEKKNYTEAFKWYRKSAEQGSIYNQYQLGYMYENGYGVSKNKDEALKWYRKAAEEGYEDAKKKVKELE